jgi:hypothetical protein
MLAPPWPSPSLERILPTPVLALLAGAHRRALAAARGRVLDLSPAGLSARPGPDVGQLIRLAVPPEGAGGADRALVDVLAGEPFDTVISVLHLAGVDDARRRLAALRAVLHPSGHLSAVEPYRRVGWRGAVAGASMPLVRASTGLRIDHPVPALVRAAGFTIVSIERKTMPGLWVPFRSVVELTAVPSGASARPTRASRP